MEIRSILAIALGSSMAAVLATDTAQSQDQSTAAACPNLTAHITLNDYNGAHFVQLCITPQGLSITGGTVNLHAYDNQSDGIFHNGFETAP